MLTEAQIRQGLDTRLEKYAGRSLFERFALFMGMAQLLELGLKGLLSRHYGVDIDSLERWTLGQVKEALKDKGLRSDFIALLESVVGYRNHMAHSFMADAFITRELFDGRETRFATRELDKGIYELEQLLFLFEWTEENNAWGEYLPNKSINRTRQSEPDISNVSHVSCTP
jgi:hypothetical protein